MSNAVIPIAHNALVSATTAHLLPSELLGLLTARRQMFLSFVRKRVRSGADAEDLLQQALLKAIEKVTSVQAHESLDAWFYRVLRNTIADHHIAWARLESRLALLAREASEAAPEDAAVCACSMGVLASIRAEYADIVRRVDIEGETIDAVAVALAVAPGTAKVRLHRARKALRSALLDYCGTDSLRACMNCACDAPVPSVGVRG
jgi:RNA polymerase sigma factor (sigma-70 family)